jgi:hypothetical protein
MNYIGIDPGLKGAVALVKPVYQGSKFILFEAERLPYDDVTGYLNVERLCSILTRFLKQSDHIICERPIGAARSFGSGMRVSTAGILTSGINFGRLTATIDLLPVKPNHLDFIHPRQWTATLFEGLPKAAKPKERSLRVFEAVCVKPSQANATPKSCRVAHDGIIDAALIAWWGSQNIQLGH